MTMLGGGGRASAGASGLTGGGVSDNIAVGSVNIIG